MVTRDAGKEKKRTFLTNIELSADEAKWLDVYLINLRYETDDVMRTTKKHLFKWLIERFRNNKEEQNAFRDSITTPQKDDDPT